MIKKILKTVRGFSPVELVIMVGFAALAAGALIFLATTPHYMAQQPVDVNINIEGAVTVTKGAVATTQTTLSRQPSAKAALGDPNPDTTNITLSDGATAATGGGVESNILVYPTGNSSSDPVNVQWAVDNIAQGGTVLLKQYAKGTTSGDVTPFSFASTTRLLVSLDTTIQGEYTERESVGFGVLKGTTISGGDAPFAIGGLDPLSLNIPVSAAIKDIRFDGWTAHGVLIASSKENSEVSGCSFVNYKIGSAGLPPEMDFDGSWPITGGSYFDHNLLTGQIKLSNNFFGKPPMDYSHNNLAIHFFNTNAQILIDSNYVEDIWWHGIIVAHNMGTATITNNIINKSLDYYIDFGFFKYPMDNSAIGHGLYPVLFSDTHMGSAVIKNNKINISPDPSLGYSATTGIVLGDLDPSQYTVAVPDGLTRLVEGNTITMTGSIRSALDCGSACRNTTVKDNIIKGSGFYGIKVAKTLFDFIPPEFLPPTGPTNNTFTNNDFSGFTAFVSELFVDQYSSNNKFTNDDFGMAGISGAIIEGDGNTFTNENFHGNYTGKLTTPSLPVLTFAYISGLFESENNTVSALKNDQPLTGASVCDQILDVKLDETGSTTNKVNSSCAKMPVEKLTALKNSILQARCEKSSGTWANNACACPTELPLDTNGKCSCPAGQHMDWKEPSNKCVSE